MVDIVDRQTRSRMMAAVRAADTGPELRLRRALWRAGLRGYRVHRRDIPGRPDVAYLSRKVAVFVDGAFWHGHPSAFTHGKSGEFWDRKIKANVDRDRRVDNELRGAGWEVVRLWDFQVNQDLESCVERVREAVRPAGPPPARH